MDTADDDFGEGGAPAEAPTAAASPGAAAAAEALRAARFERAGRAAFERLALAPGAVGGEAGWLRLASWLALAQRWAALRAACRVQTQALLLRGLVLRRVGERAAAAARGAAAALAAEAEAAAAVEAEAASANAAAGPAPASLRAASDTMTIDS